MYKALNSKQRDVMLVCLLLASHEENEWYWGVELHKVQPGQFITSLDSIRSYCARDVSVTSLRTSLLKLEKMGFLTNKSTKTGRLITICKWGTYQSGLDDTNKDVNRRVTNDQQRTNKELTSIKNDKKVKNEKEETIKDIISSIAKETTRTVKVEENYAGYPKNREFYDD